MSNVFSAMKKGEVGHARRVFHSATNYVRSIDRSSFSFGNASSQIGNAAGTFAGTAGGVAGVISMTVTGAVVGAGFLAAVSGPQVAITGAVLGLALLAKGAYSNRDSAHTALAQYVWNMVDSDAPEKRGPYTKADLEDAADAAMTLMEDGKSQVKLMGTKMAAAQTKFEKVNRDVKDLHDTFMRLKAVPPMQRNAQQENANNQEIKRTQEKLQALWEKESKSGGAIFEYVRRCMHTGNYIQAPYVIAMAMSAKFQSPSADSAAKIMESSTDYFAGMERVEALRRTFSQLSDFYRAVMPAQP
ncbi:hypothetical protein [Paraburkholderia sp.]|uniref:hypothetical protein n=1 Tax=Paraburkholderia sp. TaxID=1926495 RepID=UPI0023A5C4FE|nr:hypothetical protein [Paraburkholderia sp.]MDE1180925.1 hypothetical protein [Paraburkholderia sp.]